MTARNTNGFWHVASLVLGIASIPFVVIWFWHNLAIIHEPLHPVPPDHLIPMQVGRHVLQTVYITPLQNEFWRPWVVFTGTFVMIGFVAALTMANRGRIRVLAKVHMIATKDGGRAEPVTSGYNANSSFGGRTSPVTYMGRFERAGPGKLNNTIGGFPAR
jgi:hypothetical protein